MSSLYKTLFPEGAIPKGTKQLIIVPDGSLSKIPFEALLTDASPQSFLIKQYAISYSYSATLWLQQKGTDERESIATEGLLAIAPIFADQQTASVNPTTRSLLATVDSLSFVSDSIPTRGELLNKDAISALPESEKEVEEIANLFKTSKEVALIKTHAEANESFLKSVMLGKYKYVHIATHGFLNSTNPDLSGIVLSQKASVNDASATNSEQDGILFSNEIFSLNLNANLIVLSACETGLGQLRKGEGVIGLTRALMYAGADNLIVSLWKVADQSTADLMVDFYKGVLQQKKKNMYSSPLREAKLAMIESEKFNAPYYWSGFVLIGE